MSKIVLAVLFALPLAGLTAGQVPCSDGPAGARLCPDLVVDALELGEMWLETRSFSATSCSVVEGSAGEGERRLLRFSFSTPNVGLADLVVGAPSQHPEWFVWGACHHHWHFREYADYRLWTPDAYARWTAARAASPGAPAAEIFEGDPTLGEGMVAGHKQGFCVMDNQALVDQVPRRYTSCADQGISVGWADRYSWVLDGQWIDVTGLPPGYYVLEAEVNAERLFEESAYANNAGSTLVQLYDEDP